MPTRRFVYLAAALLIALAAAWPIWAGPGFLNTRGGGDSPFLLQRVQQLVAAWRAGHFPARWMPDANYGYGYPFFHYYAPLSIAVAGVWHWLGVDVVRAIQLSQVLGFLTAAGGMYALAWRWFRRDWAALLASAAYTLAPFHLVNVYVRGDSLAEFWAMALYPLVLWSLDRLLARPGRAPMALFSLSYAGLILSHNISALIFSPWLLLYVVCVGWNRRSWRLLGWLAAAVGLALALSAWFWLPALAEQTQAQLGPVTEGYFHFSQHFRGFDLVQRNWLFDYDVADGRAFRMGLTQAVLTALGLGGLLWGLARRRVRRGPAIFVMLTWLGATLMITPLSRLLWEHAPLLPFTQFPWRFLSVQAVVGAAAVAAGAVALDAGRRPGWLQRVAGLVFLALLLGTNLGDLQPDYIAVGEVSAETLAQYEWFTGNIGSTISAEYLPPTVQPRPYTSPWLNADFDPAARQRVVVLSGQAQATPQFDNPLTPAWQVAVTSDAARLMLPVLYWPGWIAEEQGTRLGLEAAPGPGLITLTLPRGSHDIALRLTRTPLRAIAEGIGLAALLILGSLARPLASWLWTYRWELAWLPAVAILFLAVRPQSAPPDGPLSWDFAQAAYLHPSPTGIHFTSGPVLSAYRYSAARVVAGARWTAALTWEGGVGEATLALSTPAAQRATPDQPPPLLLSQTRAVQPGVVTYTFDLPADFPAGLFIPRLTMTAGVAVTESGYRRGDLYLQPFQVAAAPTDMTPNTAPLSALVTAFSQPEPTRLEIHIAWRSATALDHNYVAALRILDSRFRVYAALDAQPGAGYLPSSGWLPGEWVYDWWSLAWDSADSHPPYVLLATLYDPGSGQVALTRRLGVLSGGSQGLTFAPPQPHFELPAAATPLDAVWGEHIALVGYTWEMTSDSLTLTLYWRALQGDLPDYTHFVHLLGPDGQLVPGRQTDGMPQANTYPTSQWVAGEIVADPSVIPLTDLPGGVYQLAIGLYRNLGTVFPRLPLRAAPELIAVDHALILPISLSLEP